jgi:hypothetical protein
MSKMAVHTSLKKLSEYLEGIGTDLPLQLAISNLSDRFHPSPNQQ